MTVEQIYQIQLTRGLLANGLIWQKIAQEGYPEGAAKALVRADYDALINSMGDVTIQLKAGLPA